LALSVGSPNKNGMHPLASWMVTVGFADTLVLERTDDSASQFDRTPAQATTHTPTPPGVSIDWPLESDLAYHAHTLMQQHTGQSLPIQLALHKRIPAGAGLGGGSSNAAAVLVGLNQLFELALPAQTLVELGQQLGSDVGFLVRAILGEPSALVTGLGEQLDPLPLPNPIHLVLIFPPFACHTGRVYHALDLIRRRTAPHTDYRPDPARIQSLARKQPLTPDALFNDLAQAACTGCPPLQEHINQLQSQLHIPIHVTGSGSTLFTITPDPHAAKALASRITSLSTLPAIATQTLSL